MKSTEISTQVRSQKNCPSCRTELPNHAHFCRHCGYALGATTTISEATNTSYTSTADEQRLLAASIDSHTPTFLQKVVGNLPMAAQHVIAVVLVRARDPEPECHLSRQKAIGAGAIAWGWLPLLALTSSLGVFSVAYANTSARSGAAGVDMFFWFGLLLIFVPSSVRLISPGASRFERISLICVVCICFYLVSQLESLFPYFGYDPFAHLRTADDIARSGHLFSENSLLTVSPFYPGLEIATNALSKLSGLSTVDAGAIVVGVAYLVLTLSLFLLYEQLTKSARIAGIATLLYMTNPHFLFFDTGFDYESLALPLATLVLFAALRQETVSSGRRRILLTALIPLAAVVATHHMTSFIVVGLLLLWTGIYALQRPVRALRSNLAKTALFGTCMALAWIGLKGNPVVNYLSSYFGGALNELGHIVTGTTSSRQLFASYSGHPASLWERTMAIASVGLITLCLPFGLLCFWQRYRHNALVWAFCIASLLYPVTQVFRFTNFGSEITDRAAAFLFIPIAFLLAIFIAQYWPTRRLNRKHISFIAAAVAVLFLGGLVLGNGPPWALLPGPYLVAADARSIEPEGVQAAIWAGSHLGPDNRMATDRTNELLMSALGDQRIVTSLADYIDVAPVFFSPGLGPNEVSILQRARVKYLVVDLRLGTALPANGFYFDPDEPDAFKYTTPIDLQALTKFNTIPQINRVFDSGNIVMYDVGGLMNAP